MSVYDSYGYACTSSRARVMSQLTQINHNVFIIFVSMECSQFSASNLTNGGHWCRVEINVPENDCFKVSYSKSVCSERFIDFME